MRIYKEITVQYDQLEQHYLIQVWVHDTDTNKLDVEIHTEQNYIDAKCTIEMVMLQMQPEPPHTQDKVTNRWG